MEQIQQGLQSTKPKPNLPPCTSQLGIKHHDVYLRVFYATKKVMYADQTGHFPVISCCRHKYITDAIELDDNYIVPNV